MIRVDVPGFRPIEFAHVVLDYNGTLAVDGHPVPGVKEALNALADEVEIHVITADTFGKVRKAMEDVRCRVSVLGTERQDEAKLSYARQLGLERTVCIGNGRNDHLMVGEATLGIAVILAEGVAVQTLLKAQIACKDIVSALELLNHPLRLIATLRS